MPEGVRTPAPGTRYATPLEIIYQRSDPSVVLAAVDAREWTCGQQDAADRMGVGRWWIGAVVLLAMVLLTVGARRRGLSWWQWYSDAPARHRG